MSEGAFKFESCDVNGEECVFSQNFTSGCALGEELRTCSYEEPCYFMYPISQR